MFRSAATIGELRIPVWINLATAPQHRDLVADRKIVINDEVSRLRALKVSGVRLTLPIADLAVSSATSATHNCGFPPSLHAVRFLAHYTSDG